MYSIKIATIEDVPELLMLQKAAFASVAQSMNWPDMPNITETIEHARDDFGNWTTLKLTSREECNDDACSQERIIGSIRGKVENDSLYIGRLMVLPECQGKGYGSKLIREIEEFLPHNRAWLNTCEQLVGNVRLYEHQGYHPFNYERINDHLTRVFLDKNSSAT